MQNQSAAGNVIQLNKKNKPNTYTGTIISRNSSNIKTYWFKLWQLGKLEKAGSSLRMVIDLDWCNIFYFKLNQTDCKSL